MKEIHRIYIENAAHLKLDDHKQKTTKSVTEVVSEETLQKCNNVNNFKSFISTISKIENLNIFNTKEDGYNPSILQRALDSGEKEDAIIYLLEGGFLFKPDEIKADLSKRFTNLRYVKAFQLVLKSHPEFKEDFTISLLEGDSLFKPDLLKRFAKLGYVRAFELVLKRRPESIKDFLKKPEPIDALLKALENTHPKKKPTLIVKTLCENHSSLNSSQKQRLFFITCQGNLDLNQVKRLIEEAKVDIFDKDINGDTALHHFCEYSTVEQLQAFIDAVKAAINANPDLSDKAKSNRLKEFLNAQNKKRVTPLMVMSLNKSVTPQMIKDMVKACADIFSKDKNGDTVLHYFSKNSTAEQLQAFIDAAQEAINANPSLPDAEAKSKRLEEFLNAQNNLGRTCLMSVVSSPNTLSGKIRILSNFKAIRHDINKKDNEGNTALMIAVKSAINHSSYLECWNNGILPLLRWGADRTIENKKNQTVLELVQYKHKFLHRLLNKDPISG